MGHGLEMMLRLAEHTKAGPGEEIKAAKAEPTKGEAEKKVEMEVADACDGAIPGQAPAERTR